MSPHTPALQQLTWYQIRLREAISAAEFAAAQSFCTLRSRPLPGGDRIDSLEVLCSGPDEAAAAADVMLIAVSDMRERSKIREHRGPEMEAIVSRLITDAAGR